MDWKIPVVLAVAALAVAGAVMVTMNKNDSKDRSDDAIIPPVWNRELWTVHVSP